MRYGMVKAAMSTLLGVLIGSPVIVRMKDV
jgi:hypothetical protein